MSLLVPVRLFRRGGLMINLGRDWANLILERQALTFTGAGSVACKGNENLIYVVISKVSVACKSRALFYATSLDER